MVDTPTLNLTFSSQCGIIWGYKKIAPAGLI